MCHARMSANCSSDFPSDHNFNDPKNLHGDQLFEGRMHGICKPKNILARSLFKKIILVTWYFDIHVTGFILQKRHRNKNLIKTIFIGNGIFTNGSANTDKRVSSELAGNTCFEYLHLMCVST
jgi:hypothetical protein